MRRQVNLSFLLSMGLLLLIAPFANAQGTFNAASCNQSDVNALINGPTHKAVNGDTINIPSGSCTWTKGITVPNGMGISIIGAGQGSTIITDKLSTGSLFTMSPTVGNALSRISGMTLLPSLPRTGYGSPITVVGTCNTSGCPNLRIDHLTGPSSWAGLGISDDTFAVVSNMFGVADHNIIGDVQPSSNGVDFINVSFGSWQGVGQYGDNSWAAPDTFGTNQAFYIESNTFNHALATDTDTGGGYGGGARFVCRFNNFNGVSTGNACSNHGTDTTGRPRGARQEENYFNTGTCTNSQQGCDTLFGFRSGVGIIFGNSFSNSNGGFVKKIVSMTPQRRWRPDSPWGACGGTSSWDVNDSNNPYYSGTVGSVAISGTSYVITDASHPGWSNNQWFVNGSPFSFVDVTKGFNYEIASNTSGSLTTGTTGSNFGVNVPSAGDSYRIMRSTVCMDQPGRGPGLLIREMGPPAGPFAPKLAGTLNLGPVNQVLDPTYEFMDSGPFTIAVASDTASIIANRDYYSESVNQPAQSSPTSPFDGSSGNGHGTLANRPPSCTQGVGYWATDQGNWNQSGSSDQGQLYVCSAPNTWTLYYTPYTFPHPIISGTDTSGNHPNPPTGLAATVQ